MFESDPGWMENAACTKANLTMFGPGTDLFFPPRDKQLYKKMSTEAKKFCYGDEATGRPPCPVRNKCLWYAVELDEQHGIWGGLSHRERNARIRKWSRDHKKEMTLQEYILNLQEGKNGSTLEGPEKLP